MSLAHGLQKAVAPAHFLLLRRPNEIPRAYAFCLKAPGVRFRALEIAFTRVLSFECLFSSLVAMTQFETLTMHSGP